MNLKIRIPPDLSGRILRNEPNFSRGGSVEDQKMRNEPNKDNARCNRAAPVFSLGLSAEVPPHRRRQPLFRETNPISPTGTITPHQKYETNPICPDRTPGPRRKNAKRTQFRPRHPTIHHSPLTIHYFTKTNPIYRTAGVSPAFPSPIIRNEPNPSYRRPCRPPNMQNKPNLQG